MHAMHGSRLKPVSFEVRSVKEVIPSWLAWLVREDDVKGKKHKGEDPELPLEQWKKFRAYAKAQQKGQQNLAGFGLVTEDA
jgi:hypothetical protein